MADVMKSAANGVRRRSEEHTSELQSRLHLVCRLLLEKKKNFEEFMDQQRWTETGIPKGYPISPILLLLFISCLLEINEHERNDQIRISPFRFVDHLNL